MNGQAALLWPPALRSPYTQPGDIISARGFWVAVGGESSTSGTLVHVDTPLGSKASRLTRRRPAGAGCMGLGHTHRLHAIPSERGSVLVMDGYAANVLKHCVRANDTKGKSASLMLRGLVEGAMMAANAAEAERTHAPGR
jgi:hypothetical protein